jgi:dipeptidyl aminopeptidase/acylaminoacyl peptidase
MKGSVSLLEVKMIHRSFPRILIGGIFLFVLFQIPQLAQEAKEVTASNELRVLSARDILRISRVSNPHISPDGQWVIYTQSERDMEHKDLKRTIQIWRVGVDGSERRQMTYRETDCTSPSWFPDSRKIAFISSGGSAEQEENNSSEEGPKNQIFFMHVDGGEAWQVTNHKEGVQSFEISPDGTKVLFVSEDPLSEDEKKKKKKKDDAEVVDEKFRMSHLWFYDIEEKKAVRLTQGDFTVSDAHWSPDVKEIVYVSRPTPHVDDSWKSDIWVVDLESRTPRKIYENPGRDSSPRWSPDGKTLAFASDPHIGTNTWYSKLYLIPAEGGEPQILLEDFDLDFGIPVWSPDGKRIYWTAGDGTTQNLFSVEINMGQVSRIVAPPGANSQYELSKDGKRWVWFHASANRPGEIYTASLDLENILCLSKANPWLKEKKIKFGKVETVKWKNSDGEWIEGVLTWPVDYDPGQKYPLILNPHGGPSSARIETFSSTNQFFAGNGFIILQPNFRGSSNYGQEFLNANRGYWGIRDYDDCMTGVDYCIERGWADPERLICYGWSYGGYMSFWIVTQTDRFKAVSPGAGLSNLYSMYSTTDIPRYMAWFFGTPWKYEETYEKLSPIRHVENVKSSVMIMHGAEDERVPPTQSVEFYQALRDLDKNVIFVRYPREGHGIGEPRHQMDRLRRYLFFFAKHVNLTPVSEKENKKEN